MLKDFDRWNEHKKTLDANSAPRVYVHECELWFAHLGTNIGFEQDGRDDESLRPILAETHEISSRVISPMLHGSPSPEP